MSKNPSPSMDQWLKEAKAQPDAKQVGMYLVHNGTVRETAKALVRNGASDTKPVTGMHFSYNATKVEEAVAQARTCEGIYYIRVWLNEGDLALQDDIMYVLVGGDTRPHVIDALQQLVGQIKNECVMEAELHE